ncbi:hypothetical protein ABMA27_000548 [Loxostege sticticalis]|uniref:Uncharacterized protein n=1 Tax=Loxostege sticticalis TaxID=481309 RepID=A0ABR3INT7_LOXSC
MVLSTRYLSGSLSETCQTGPKSLRNVLIYKPSSWNFLNRMKKKSSKEAKDLKKAVLAAGPETGQVTPQEGCCVKWTCGTQFCMGDVMCIAVAFMLLLVIMAQAYKVVMGGRRAGRRSASRCTC